MADHLTPLDAAFLELEEGDEGSHMHIGSALVFEQLPGGGAPALEDVRRLAADRLELLPRFNCRLSSARTGRVRWPAWEPDPSFDVTAHVRRASLPAPGGEEELLDWLGDFYSHRLDRARPLWEMTLLDGLPEGRWALVSKVHHCLVDGVSGASITSLMLDAEPSPKPESRGVLALLPEQGQEPESNLLRSLAHGARAGIGAAAHPRRLADAFARSRSLAELLIRDELVGAPSSSLDVKVGGARRLAYAAVPLDELKLIKRRLGGTVNDVVLAAAAGGLQRLLEARGETVDGGELRAMVPVSLRTASEDLALGNRISSLFVDIPVEERDTLERYRRTVSAAEELKRGNQALGAETLVDLAGVAPPVLHGIVARLLFAPRLFNVTITNVPGPQATLYAFGAPLRRVIPLVPIFAGHAVGVAAVSYDGELVFGINADRASVPDLELIRAGIEETAAELGEIARSRPQPAAA